MRMRLALLIAGSAMLLAAGEPDPKTATEHVVKAGETLGGIASRAEVPRVLIIEANGLKEPYKLKAGQRLVIPRRRSHEVAEGETGFGIAMDYGVPWGAIAGASGIDPRAPIRTGQKLVIPTMAKAAATSAAPSADKPEGEIALTERPPEKLRWPVSGKVRRDFVARKGSTAFHDGIDVLAEEGTAVRASAAGTVIFAGEGPPDYGLTVIVHHGGRWTTTYGNLGKVTVKDGEKVKAGERLGKVGMTGIARQPQLHYEVRRNRLALDPAAYLPKPDKD
jgi:murein DD-endopeptidase MepM/ murein hydrolase activator NlpD